MHRLEACLIQATKREAKSRGVKIALFEPIGNKNQPQEEACGRLATARDRFILYMDHLSWKGGDDVKVQFRDTGLGWLEVSVLVLKAQHEDGEVPFESMLYQLAERDEPYVLQTMENPLIDYPSTMEEYRRKDATRKQSMARGDLLSARTASQEARSIWLSAHWYVVEEYLPTIIGMSVAVWEGYDRSHTVHIEE